MRVDDQGSGQAESHPQSRSMLDPVPAGSGVCWIRKHDREILANLSGKWSFEQVKNDAFDPFSGWPPFDDEDPGSSFELPKPFDLAASANPPEAWKAGPPEVSADDADLHLAAAWGFLDLEMYAEAHAELDYADKCPDRRGHVVTLRFEVFVKQENWKEVAAYGEALTDVDPDNTDWLRDYMDALYHLGRYDDALQAVRHVEQGHLARDDSEIRYRMARLEAANGETKLAVWHLHNSIVIDPRNRDAALREPGLAPFVEKLPPSQERMCAKFDRRYGWWDDPDDEESEDDNIPREFDAEPGLDIDDPEIPF